MAVKFKGEEKVLKNLNDFIMATKGRTHAGMKDAALFIIENATPITPIEFGNLRKSFYKKPLLLKGEPALEIGNNAEYAVYVHENMESNHPVGEAKFLEKTIVRNTRTIMDIIASRLKV